MDLSQLKNKASSLPLAPGVYIMRDKENSVIYVGKAKKLRNRVSQYFQDSASHSPKTRQMISKIDHFDVIVAASEFEALVLECSLIKQHLPKYNILLKDDKGYPYLRFHMKEHYPQITLVQKISDDGADYYGPFGSRGVTQNLMDAIRLTLKMPNCSKKFPRDIGKGRPCLNYHLNQCEGWCQDHKCKEEYMVIAEQAKQLLTGNYKQVAEQIRSQMLKASEELNFELAASLRDRLHSVESLGKKQLVTAGSFADTDVIGYASTETKACFTVLHFSGGNLLDKDFEILNVPEDPKLAVSSLIKQYYLNRGFAPRIVLLPFDIEDMELFSFLLSDRFGKATKIKVPQKGDNAKLVALAVKNAQEEALRLTDKEERIQGSLLLLGKMLKLDIPKRIESFDISNISGTDIVASMVVYQEGKPQKSEYKRFRIDDLPGQDDYASMAQVVTRRFSRYLSGDIGFKTLPDLLLIDGGVSHALTALKALEGLGIDVPVFGMVKDNRHRTRALVTPQGEQIAIDTQPSVFSLIGNIQEETHRFAISYHRKLRSKRLRYSQLDGIPGIGPKRKEDLLKVYRSLTAISEATLSDLTRHLPQNAALAVYKHFHQNEEGQGNDPCEL